MDIEEEGNDRNNARSNSLDGIRFSHKSRKSNESFLSIGGTNYYDRPSISNQKYTCSKSGSVSSPTSLARLKRGSIIAIFLRI